MSEETMDLTPQLTLTPDSAATQPQAPSLTLEPNADQQQAQAAQQAAQAQREAWGCVSRGVAAAGGIQFTCFGDKPETAIPIQIEVMR